METIGTTLKFRSHSKGARLTGPKPKEIKVETFRNDYRIRTPIVEKLSLQSIAQKPQNMSP